MKHSFLLLSFILLSCIGSAQNARIQFIHNSADVLTRSVDIYSSDTLLVSNLDFRSASVFMNIGTTTDLLLSVADSSSMGVDDAYYSTALSLAVGGSYLLIIEGILSTTGYEPAPAFDIEVFDNARELGMELTGTDILFYNGSSDAPSIDIVEDELLLLTAYEDLAQGTFSGYISVPAADYHLRIDNYEQSIAYTNGHAPLSTLGMAGRAVTILTSGFLSPAYNNNGPSFGLWMATADGGPMTGLTESNAYIQLLHNSADINNDVVDIYWNGVRLADDLQYHNATAYLPVPSGIELTIAVSPSESIDDSAPLLTFDMGQLQPSTSHIAVLNGMSSTAGFNPALTLAAAVFHDSRTQSLQPSNTDALFIQGSTDALLLDIAESELINQTILEDIGYGDFNGYFEFPTVNAEFEVVQSATQNVLGEFEASFLGLGLQGEAVTIVSGGFADPAVNNNGDPFGLWLATADGGPMLQLNMVITPVLNTNVQFIHNAAESTLAGVDIYLNGALWIDDMAFRSATSFLEIPAAVLNLVSVTPVNAQGVDEAIVTFEILLDSDEDYILMLSGIHADSGYNPAPDLELMVVPGALQQALNPEEVDVMTLHAATDLAAVNLSFSPVSTNLELDGYGSSNGYISLAGNYDYGLHVETQIGNILIGNYILGAASMDLAGQAMVLFASGFLNPANNSNGATLEWWAALTDGSSFALSGYTGILPLSVQNNVVVFPNPVHTELVISGMTEQGSIEILDLQGRILQQHQIVGSSIITVDVCDLEPGYYILRSASASAGFQIPFIKE